MANKSSHILNASSNLLGICFIVLTSLKVLKKSGETLIDDAAILAILLFMSSCILSFMSIRNENNKGLLYEKIADYLFLTGLILLFATTLLFSFDIIQ